MPCSGAIEGEAPFTILDLGCGPGRDLARFVERGHTAVGLDGAKAFVEMAGAQTGCEVLHQNFIELELPPARFDGVFANASLFHAPRAALGDLLRALHASLKPRGVLFASNPAAKTRTASTASATAASTTSRTGVPASPRRASRRFATTTARRACHASSSPGWRRCGRR